MREFAEISGIYRKYVHPDIFDQLLSEYPEGQTGTEGHAFVAKLDRTDPQLARIERILMSAGMMPHQRGTRWRPSAENFIYRFRREYEDSDLSHFHWLQYVPEEVLIDTTVRCDGQVCVPVRELKKHRWVRFSAQESRNFVRDDVKIQLENAGFKGLRFVPTIPFRGDNPENEIMWGDLGQAWWLLDSTITLPMLSPDLDLRDYRGAPLQPGDRSGHFWVRDGFYEFGELHYQQSAWNDVSDFDIALTHEGRALNDRREVVSRRFFEALLELGLKPQQWWPVHVDED